MDDRSQNMLLDDDTCYQALRARDRRFDGCFFVGVTTTGIYCRPICPARCPARNRCTYFHSAANAEQAGFRACFRCRPELAPGSARVDSKSRLIQCALRRIEEGFLNEQTVDQLAARLGITARHLRRTMEDEIGLAPIEIAQTQRVAVAKRLIQDTRLPLTDVAHASGFGSVRRFNAVFRQRFGRAPSTLRQKRPTAILPGFIQVRLDYRPPYEWRAMLRFLGARAIPGVETIDDDTYRRSVRLGSHTGTILVRQQPQHNALVASVSMSLVPTLSQVIPRLRALFDLDARPDLVREHLIRDRVLAPSVRARPGLRIPGAFDAFELGVRAILGQQVSVQAASTVAGRFARRYGSSESPFVDDMLFPVAADIARVSASHVHKIGIPRTRAQTIVEFAKALSQGRLDLSRGVGPEHTIGNMTKLPGIGPWTAHYIAMRALQWPDAFPSTDLVLRRALGVTTGLQAERRAHQWRPWRGYAALHLWTAAALGG